MSGNNSMKDKKSLRRPRLHPVGDPPADLLPVGLVPVPVAGGGLLHRRVFLKSGALLGSAAALGVAGTFSFAAYGEESLAETAPEFPAMPPATPIPCSSVAPGCVPSASSPRWSRTSACPWSPPIRRRSGMRSGWPACARR